MRIVNVGSFEEVDDPVKTEEIIYRQLVENAATIETTYIYVAMPLAWTINRAGLMITQNLLDEICNKFSNENLFFVCQHILVNQLNFHNNLVFTPHATILDSYEPIPHHTCNYDLSRITPWEDRKYTFSFIGSFMTHPIRAKLYEILKDREDCLVESTGNWHFEGTPERQQENKKRYVEILGDTKYSLCPRGTGPSTIRIWESMAMGACPIILSDYLKMPLERELSTTMWLKMAENIDRIKDIDFRYDNTEYFDKFSNDKLYLSVTRRL